MVSTWIPKIEIAGSNGLKGREEKNIYMVLVKCQILRGITLLKELLWQLGWAEEEWRRGLRAILFENKPNTLGVWRRKSNGMESCYLHVYIFLPLQTLSTEWAHHKYLLGEWFNCFTWKRRGWLAACCFRKLDDSLWVKKFQRAFGGSGWHLSELKNSDSQISVCS